MIHIYYGYGRGKTSTLNGTAIRAHGAGMKVAVFRFLKGRKTFEDEIFEKLKIDVMSFHSSKKFVIEMNDDEKRYAKQEALNGMEYIKSIKDNYDLILIDEFIDLIDQDVNFITEEQALDFIKCFKGVEVLISGHRKYEKIIEYADLVTEYLAKKHYYNQGILARNGIDK